MSRLLSFAAGAGFGLLLLAAGAAWLSPTTLSRTLYPAAWVKGPADLDFTRIGLRVRGAPRFACVDGAVLLDEGGARRWERGAFAAVPRPVEDCRPAAELPDGRAFSFGEADGDWLRTRIGGAAGPSLPVGVEAVQVLAFGKGYALRDRDGGVWVALEGEGNFARVLPDFPAGRLHLHGESLVALERGGRRVRLVDADGTERNGPEMPTGRPVHTATAADGTLVLLPGQPTRLPTLVPRWRTVTSIAGGIAAVVVYNLELDRRWLGLGLGLPLGFAAAARWLFDFVVEAGLVRYL